MNREEIKAEALINLGSEPAPKEWEKLPCIKEQMPSCIGGEVSLQRFVGTDICAWFVGIGGLWEPQSDYFRVSLPPAEGATDKFRDVLHEVQRLIETEGGATESEMKAIWNSLSCAITESERRSQPPAEGAEQRIRVRNILQDFYRRGEYELEQAEEDIMRLFQQQPTAEGAEDFLKKYTIYCKNVISIEGKTWVLSTVIPQAMQEFATLHAQRIAEKMVSERLREKLIKYSMYASEQWCDTSDRELSEKNIDKYLKTREK